MAGEQDAALRTQHILQQRARERREHEASPESGANSNSVRTHLSQSCSQYEVVRNINGSVVGQLIGPSLSIKGFFNTSVAVCIARDVTIPVCWIKYSVTDFVSMDGQGLLSAPLLVETTSSLEDQVSIISGIRTPVSPQGSKILKSQ